MAELDDLPDDMVIDSLVQLLAALECQDVVDLSIRLDRVERFEGSVNVLAVDEDQDEVGLTEAAGLMLVIEAPDGGGLGGVITFPFTVGELLEQLLSTYDDALALE